MIQVGCICFCSWVENGVLFFFFAKAGKGRLREVIVLKLQTVKYSCK